jgi:hypothetical protein
MEVLIYLKYKHLTNFYGSVERALATNEDGSPRYFNDVQSAVQAAVKIGETGPFTLVTRVELIPDERRPEPGGQSSGGPPPIYWQPPPPKAPPDPAILKQQEVRRQLQADVYSGLTNFGVKKRDAEQIVRALPIEMDDLSKALNWAIREAR